MRTFVAVNLDETLRARLGHAQRRLEESGADVKWANPEGLHVTLKFLGEVEEARVGEISRAIGQALDGCGAFRLRLRGAGSFPSPTAPRVIWVGTAEGAEALADMAARVEQAAQALGFERERRPFAGHITLGRARSPRGRERLVEGIAALAHEEFGEMTVEQAALMKSRLTPQGAIYSSVQAFALAPA